jgi:hypothetical protein
MMFGIEAEEDCICMCLYVSVFRYACVCVLCVLCVLCALAFTHVHVHICTRMRMYIGDGMRQTIFGTMVK